MIVLDEESLRRLQQEVIHPNVDAICKRDTFLKKYTVVPIRYRDDGGFEFDLPMAETTKGRS